MAANGIKDTMNEMEAEVDRQSDGRMTRDGASLELSGQTLSHALDQGSLHLSQPDADRDAERDPDTELGLHVVEKAEPAPTDGHFSLRSLRAEAEIYALSKTLEYTGWNRRRAAQLLSISYRGILYKIRQHNLTPRSVQMQVQAVAQANQIAKAE